MANEVRITVTSRDQSQAGFRSARQSAQGLGDETKKIGTIAAGILASQVFSRIARAAKDAFVSTITAASSLNESINATQVVFGDAATGVLAIGENASQSMGLSQRAFNEAAVSMANFAQTIAGDGGNVTKVVEDITQRAADFASVMNLEVEQALGLFQSGLAGQSRPLRQYGIDISDAAVKTFAYANGIAEAGREMTEAEKVQARYGLIMEQTASMAGDFANTSGDLANSQRILKAEIENTQAEMGQNLLPVLASLTGVMTDLVVGFGELPGPARGAAMAIVAVAAAAGPAALAVRAFGLSLTGLLLHPAVIGAAAILGPVAFIIADIGRVSRQARDDAKEMASQGIDPLLDRIGELNDELPHTERLLGVLPKTLGGWAKSGKEAHAITSEFSESISELDGLLAEMVAAGSADQAAEAVRELGQRLGLTGAELDAFIVEHLPGYVAAQGAAATATGNTADEVQDLETKLAGLRDELFLTAGALIDLETKQDRLSDAVERATGVAEDAEAADQDRRAALRDVASASHDLITTMYDQEAATADVISETERARRKFIEVAIQMGYTETEANDLADAYGLIPSDVLTIVTLRDLASKDLGNIRSLLDSLDGREARTRVINEVIQNRRVNTFFSTFGQQGFSGQNFPRTGGIIGPGRGMRDGGVAGGVPTVINDGVYPEAVDLPNGSRVIPSLDQATDRNQLNGDKPQEVVVRFDFEGAEDAFVEFIRRAFRVRGVQLGTGS